MVFIVSFNTILVKEGDTVVINYTIQGYPPPEISLLVKDKDNNNADITATVIDSITMITLVLTNINRSDPTEYYLVAYNGIEIINTTTTVTILCKLT